MSRPRRLQILYEYGMYVIALACDDLEEGMDCPELEEEEDMEGSLFLLSLPPPALLCVPPPSCPPPVSLCISSWVRCNISISATLMIESSASNTMAACREFIM